MSYASAAHDYGPLAPRRAGLSRWWFRVQVLGVWRLSVDGFWLGFRGLGVSASELRTLCSRLPDVLAAGSWGCLTTLPQTYMEPQHVWQNDVL